MRKYALAIFAVAILSAILVKHVDANGIDVYINLNKVEYEPGEQGTIYVSIRNTSEDPIEVKKIYVEFSSWMLYTEEGWDELGNMTIVYSPPIQIPSENGTVDLDPISFTVPTDGRATSTSARIFAQTNEGLIQGYTGFGTAARVPIVSVIESSNRSLLRAVDNIVVLMTVVAILAIVGSIIIAAAVFLSGRRSRVMWRKEE